MTQLDLEDADFKARIPEYVQRVETCMDRALPAAEQAPCRLHEAMRYAALGGGKRMRPLLVYASGECLGVELQKLDVAAVALEFIHAFSLVHDDLPAMDNDDLRRGLPTVHRKFNEETTILAADALQPLAFEVIAASAALDDREARELVGLVTGACGSLGMTGGEAIDIASEGCDLSADELQEMHGLKTGALIRAAIMSPCSLAYEPGEQQREALDRFSRDIGLAFQIRDDLLDVHGQSEIIGKPAGSDQALDKATWPSLFGIDESIGRCNQLLDSAYAALDTFGGAADPLRMLAAMIVERIR